VSDFPDIDFSVDCPICDGGLEYDGDAFVCPECRVSWGRQGYGHEATLHRGDEELCEARCPSSANVLEEGRFCHLDVGHDGDHEVTRLYAGRATVSRWRSDS
jgi:hypothetical protein